MLINSPISADKNPMRHYWAQALLQTTPFAVL
jgi:hypothetical protein